MGKTKIEWASDSWNPIRARNRATGQVGTWCSKIAPGCANCYAERMNQRNLPNNSSMVRYAEDQADKVELFLDDAVLREPLKWKKPKRVFVCSMTDLFHQRIPHGMTQAVFDVMGKAEQHEFLVLTKRPERIKPVLYGEEGQWFYGGGDYLPNVRLGPSVSDQGSADRNIPIILEICSHGWKNFVSYEPALGPVDFGLYLTRNLFKPLRDPLPGIGWLIAGGESGPDARPAHPDWFRSARDQCVAAGVPFFFKQWGGFSPVASITRHADEETMLRICRAVEARTVAVNLDGSTGWEGSDGQPVNEKQNPWAMERVGKRAAGRLLDGREWNEFPG